MKIEAMINVVAAIVILISSFFNQSFAIGLAVAYLLISAVYKYIFVMEKKQ
ncbi:MAG: hypothetical protein ACLFP1_07585 [Candidatus Goldiibacteriota bacterium]